MEIGTLAPENMEIHEVDQIKRKMHFTGSVVKTTLAGVVVDIGVGIPGVVHISQMREEPINRVEDVVQVGQDVDVWVRRVFPKKDRIELTMIRPLELDWRDIDKDLVIKGKVVRLEKFGAFIDIGAERPGLVHISEMAHDYVKTPGELVKEGDEVEVKVLSVNRRKKQIKLSMKALEDKPIKAPKEVTKDSPPPRQTAAVEEPKEEPVPTAMEMAMREAVERSKTSSKDSYGKDKRKGSSSSDEMEDIFSRTLRHKPKTVK